MFFVIDKSKIFSYIIAVCTVVVLFIAASNLNTIDSKNTIPTSANDVEINELSNKISLNTIDTRK